MKTKSLTVNGIYAGIAKVFGMAVPLIVMPYILRTLGTESYGKIAYVQSLVSYFTLLATLGLSDLSLRECSIVRNQPEQFSIKVSQIFTVSLFTTGLAFVLFQLYTAFVPDARKEYLLYIVYSLMIIGSGLSMNWLYWTVERFDLSSIREIVGKTVYLALCFLLVHNSNDYVIYGFVMVLGTSLIPFAFNQYGVWKGRCGAKPRILFDAEFVPHLKAVFYLGLMTLGSKLFSSSDVILTKWLVTGNGDVSAGLYNSGIVLPLVVEQLLFVIASVITPRLYGFLGNNDERQSQLLTNAASNIMYFVAVPAVVTCMVFPKELLFLLGGDSYVPAYNILRIYSFVLITAVAITLAGTRTYIARRKEKKLFIILLSMALLNIALDFVFIKHFGITGGAIATIISNISLMVLELSLEKSWGLVFTKEKLKYLAGAVVVLIVFLITRYVSSMSPEITMLISIGVAGICYVIFMLAIKESTLTYFMGKIKPNKTNITEQN